MILCANEMIPCKSFGLLCIVSCSVFLPFFGCLVYPRNYLFISCRERVWCTSIQQPHCAKEFVQLSENLCCYQSFVLLSEVRIVETWDLPPATEVTQCKVGEGQTRTTSSKMHNLYTHCHWHNCWLPSWKLWRPSGSFKRIRYCSRGVRCRIMIPVLTKMRRRMTEGQSRMYKMLEMRCSRTDGERLGFFSHWTWNGGTVTLSIFFHDLHNAHYNTLLSHNCTG